MKAESQRNAVYGRPVLDGHLDDSGIEANSTTRTRTTQADETRRDTRAAQTTSYLTKETVQGTDARDGVQIETRKLRALKPFPLQVEYFDEGSEDEISVLAMDIKENGMRHLIEVLPENSAGYRANTIIHGHRRKRACEINGETEVRVLVRHDLAEADQYTIEREFLEDNVNRRHLDPLSRARAALRLYEIERGRKPGKLRTSEKSDARDRVGKTIGVSGRTLSRYWSLLETPRAVQDAFRAGNLTLVAASKVATLDKPKQAEISAQIETGEKPKAVVAAFLSKPRRKQPKPDDVVAGLARALRRAIDDLAGQEDEISSANVTKFGRDLRQGRKLLRRLLDLREMDSTAEPETRE